MLNLLNQKIPELFTQRLILRPLLIEDAPEIFILRSDPSILTYLGKEPAQSIDDAVDFIRLIHTMTISGQGIMWGIALRENPSKLIGNICYWQILPDMDQADIGYVLHPQYWKKGIMHEAILGVLKYGIEVVGLKRIEARIHAENTASSKLLEKSGFNLEMILKDDEEFRGVVNDTAVYCLNRD